MHSISESIERPILRYGSRLEKVTTSVDRHGRPILMPDSKGKLVRMSVEVLRPKPIDFAGEAQGIPPKLT